MAAGSQEEGLDPLRYSAARPELAPFVPDRLRRALDVGCGTGGFASTLRAQGSETELWGVEPEPAAAEIARANYDHVRTGFFPDSVLELPERYFDAVFMLDVLEHMPAPEAALDGARGLLVDGGVVVASIPNARHFDVWWPLVRHGRWTYTETGLMDRTHLRWFTRSSIQDLFADRGWLVLSLVGINRSEPVGWKARAIARLGRRTEDMFFVQYVVTARPSSVGQEERR